MNPEAEIVRVGRVHDFKQGRDILHAVFVLSIRCFSRFCNCALFYIFHNPVDKRIIVSQLRIYRFSVLNATRCKFCAYRFRVDVQPFFLRLHIVLSGHFRRVFLPRR